MLLVPGGDKFNSRGQRPRSWAKSRSTLLQGLYFTGPMQPLQGWSKGVGHPWALPTAIEFVPSGDDVRLTQPLARWPKN
jgi:hypothetical protein